MNKNVLTTALPDVAGYPNLYAGNALADWLAAIDNGGAPDEAAAEAFTVNNTWSNRIENMLDKLYPARAARCDERYYGKLSIVVLNYNNKGIIDKCTASLLRYKPRYDYEVVIVDNQSTDGSYEQLKARFGDEITLVRNSKNGCSSGRNLGAASAKGAYILFLDSDQWATDRYWLDTYLHIHATADNFGAVAWNGGWFDRYAAGYIIVDNYTFRYMPPSAQHRADIGYLATCGFLMDKALFEEIGGFDEAYDPTCYEDTDLTLKIRHAGRECYYSPCLGVVHLPHQTTKAGSEAHMKRITERQKYFAEKWRQLNPALLNYIREH
jgi:GT2 family glycosyltransferase